MVTDEAIDIIRQNAPLKYDFGGGAGPKAVYHDDPDLSWVTVDIMPRSKTELDYGVPESSYIQADLNNVYSFPPANFIYMGHAIEYIDNLDNLITTINNSLKSKGILEIETNNIPGWKPSYYVIDKLVSMGYRIISDNTNNPSYDIMYKRHNVTDKRNITQEQQDDIVDYEEERDTYEWELHILLEKN